MTADDTAVAVDLATQAGQLLVALRARVGFDEPDYLRDEGDRQSHVFLAAELAKLRPGDAVLSEEGDDDLSRLDAERLWIVDPLDGTNEYGEPGRDDWAVHVALWERSAAVDGHGGLIAAAVALPARRLTLSTSGPAPELPSVGDPPRIAASRSRKPAWLDTVSERIGGVTIPIGSAGMKAMSILLGESDAYVHSGRMKEWDSAAPAAVAAAAGLHVSRLDGSPLQFNTRERLTLDLLICRVELADRLLEACRDLSPPPPPR